MSRGELVMVLNDGVTYSPLKGCRIIETPFHWKEIFEGDMANPDIDPAEWIKENFENVDATIVEFQND